MLDFFFLLFIQIHFPLVWPNEFVCFHLPNRQHLLSLFVLLFTWKRLKPIQLDKGEFWHFNVLFHLSIYFFLFLRFGCCQWSFLLLTFAFAFEWLVPITRSKASQRFFRVCIVRRGRCSSRSLLLFAPRNVTFGGRSTEPTMTRRTLNVRIQRRRPIRNVTSLTGAGGRSTLARRTLRPLVRARFLTRLRFRRTAFDGFWLGNWFFGIQRQFGRSTWRHRHRGSSCIRTGSALDWLSSRHFGCVIVIFCNTRSVQPVETVVAEEAVFVDCVAVHLVCSTFRFIFIFIFNLALLRTVEHGSLLVFLLFANHIMSFLRRFGVCAQFFSVNNNYTMTNVKACFLFLMTSLMTFDREEDCRDFATYQTIRIEFAAAQIARNARLFARFDRRFQFVGSPIFRTHKNSKLNRF